MEPISKTAIAQAQESFLYTLLPLHPIKLLLLTTKWIVLLCGMFAIISLYSQLP